MDRYKLGIRVKTFDAKVAISDLFPRFYFLIPDWIRDKSLLIKVDTLRVKLLNSAASRILLAVLL